MKQSSHAWIAIRAVGLLEEEGEAKGLVELLKPSVKTASIGAWIPDMQDSKLGSGDTDNHVFKMEPYKGAVEERFVTSKKDLLKRLGSSRRMAALISDDNSLDDAWWATPYKADPGPDQNIANRALALSTTLADFLILGDTTVISKLPRQLKLPEKLTPGERTRSDQAALYFFMLSHFVADACMPCHCDGRYLASYDARFHPEWEAVMSKPLDPVFIGDKLSQSPQTPDDILNLARQNDKALGVKLTPTVPVINDNDIWKETVALCRASYTLNNIIAHPKDFPPDSLKTLSVKDLAANTSKAPLLKAVTAASLTDAVLNVAVLWKQIWKKFVPAK